MEEAWNRIAVRCVLPATQVGCYAGAGYLVGKNVLRAAAVVGYKTGSLAADFLEKKMVSILWSNSANGYVDEIKKNVVSDLTKAAGLVAGGILMEKLQDRFNPKAEGYFPEIFNDLYKRIYHYFGNVYPAERVEEFFVDLPAKTRLTAPNSEVSGRCNLECLKKVTVNGYEKIYNKVLEIKSLEPFFNSTEWEKAKAAGEVVTNVVINNPEYPAAAYLGFKVVRSPYTTSRNIFTAASLIILVRAALGL